MVKETREHLVAAARALKRATDKPLKLSQRGRQGVEHLLLDHPSAPFLGVQFRRVRGQPLHLVVLAVSREEILDFLCPVGGEPVPDHDQGALHPLPKVPQGQDRLLWIVTPTL